MSRKRSRVAEGETRGRMKIAPTHQQQGRRRGAEGEMSRGNWMGELDSMASVCVGEGELKWQSGDEVKW